MISTRFLTTSALLAAFVAATSGAGAATTLSTSAADYDTHITGTGDIQFDFDYSSFSHLFFNGAIPVAPRTTDASTTGIFITANHDGVSPAESVAAIFPKNLDAGAGTAMPNFVFTFDAWNNTGTETPLTGTTNYQVAGVNYEAGPIRFAALNDTTAAAQGPSLGITGDNGALDDYLVHYNGVRYLDRGDQSANTDPNFFLGDASDPPSVNVSGLVNADVLIANGGDTTFAGSAGSSAGSSDWYDSFFPANDAVNPSGVPNNRWATHAVSVVNGIFSYAIDGRVLVQKDLAEAAGVSDMGTLMLGFWDRFGGSVATSPPGANFVIYDNIELDILNTVPTVDISGFIDTLAGDLNDDGFVGIADLNIILGNWNQTVTAGDPLAGDPSGDGFVGIADLNEVLGNWNAGTPPPAAGAVPEPATLALLGLGGLAALRRR